MYLCSNKNSFYIHEPFGSRARTRKPTHVIRTLHIRETRTWFLQNTLVEPCLYVKVTGLCSNTRGIFKLTRLLIYKNKRHYGSRVWLPEKTGWKGKRGAPTFLSPNCIQRDNRQQTAFPWDSGSFFFYRRRFGRNHGFPLEQGVLLSQWRFPREIRRNRIFLFEPDSPSGDGKERNPFCFHLVRQCEFQSDKVVSPPLRRNSDPC